MMQGHTHRFTTIETHTMGEPTRIITSGFPEIKGQDMMARKQFLEMHYDHLRQALMCEPRGHNDMVGALLLPKVHDEAAFGVVYLDAQRWINMCGHATMGCAVYAIESGLVPICEPITTIVMDTPSGMVTAKVKIAHGKAKEVTLYNVPSFLYQKDVNVELDNKSYTISIAFGGTFFALFDASQLGIALEREDIATLIPFTKKLLRQLNMQCNVKHPTLPIARVVNVEYYLTLDKYHQRNIVIAEEGQVDRSPCGTGTSAKLAYLYANHALSAQEVYVNESFTGAKFYGTYEKPTMVEDFIAIHPLITGMAHIIGESTFFIDEDDPLTYGFRI